MSPLRIDPAQRHRLEEIRDNLHARITEAEREGWAGEAEGLKVSLAAAATTARRAEHVHLGIPAYHDIAAATLAAEGPMNTDDLAAALRAGAAGLYPLETGTELLISNGTFLHRDDFTSRFISHGASDGTPMAAIDWDAAITALNGSGLPCSGGKRRILLLSASLASGIPRQPPRHRHRRPQHRPAGHCYPPRSRKTTGEQQTSTVALVLLNSRYPT